MRHLVWTIMLLAGAAAPCLAQVAGTISQSGNQVPRPAQAAREPPKNPARIAGKVLSVATDEPLARTMVALMPTETRPDSSTYSTSTDAAGNFAMADLPPGRYRLWADRTGYVRTEFGSRSARQMGTTITLGESQEMKGLEIRLQPHAVIAGRVTDDNGEPLAHVQMQAMTYRYMQSRRQLFPAGQGSTNDLGEYRIFGLAPGRYYLNATPMDRGMQWNSIDSTAGPRRNEPDESYAATYYPGTNDPKSATQLHAVAGRVMTNVDFRLLRTRTVRVRGRVVNAGSGRSGVMLVPRNSGYFAFGRPMSATRGADGSFEIRGVTPGSYYVIANVFEANERQVGRVPVDVGQSDIEGVEVMLSSGTQVTGTVQAEAGAQVNLAEVRLFLEPAEFTMFGGGGTGSVKADGSFLIRNIIPDTYRVRAMGGQNQFYVKSVRAGDQEAPDGEFTILPGTAPSLTVVVAAANGQVTGSVTAEKTEAIKGATVVLIPEANKREQAAAYRTATLDQYGKFNLTGVPPGEYKLFAWDAVETGQWMDREFLSAFESKGKAVSIGQNTAVTAEVELLEAAKADAAQ